MRLSVDSAGWEEFRGTLFSDEEMEWSWSVDRTDWTVCSRQNRDSTHIYQPGLTCVPGRALFNRELVGF